MNGNTTDMEVTDGKGTQASEVVDDDSKRERSNGSEEGLNDEERKGVLANVETNVDREAVDSRMGENGGEVNSATEHEDTTGKFDYTDDSVVERGSDDLDESHDEEEGVATKTPDKSDNASPNGGTLRLSSRNRKEQASSSAQKEEVTLTLDTKELFLKKLREPKNLADYIMKESDFLFEEKGSG